MKGVDEGALVPDAATFGLAFAISLTITLAVAFAFEGACHWFLLPVTACGTLMLLDAIDLVSGRRAVFDPIAIVGVVGVHFFFLAPLLHAAWDWWMHEIEDPPVWRDWLGAMGLINLVGLVLYRIGSRSGAPLAAPRRLRIDRARFLPIAASLIAVSLLVEVYVFARLGGIAEQVETVVKRKDYDAVGGMGWAFVVGEAFVAVSLLAFLVLFGREQRARAWKVLIPVFVAFLALRIAFGGLRGARCNIVFAVAWAVMAIDFWVRPVPRSFLAVGGVALVAFTFIFGLFKDGGFDALEAATSSEAREKWVNKTKRGPEVAILGDLGRSDVQAFALCRTVESSSDFHFGLGRSYLGDLACLVPGSLWPGRPSGKIVEATELCFGSGSFAGTDEYYSSRQWGLAGELLLNFGALSVPLGYLFFGWLVRRVRFYAHALAPDDPRRLLLPLAVIGCPLALLYDLDNIELFLLQHGLFIGLVLIASTRRADASPPDPS